MNDAMLGVGVLTGQASNGNVAMREKNGVELIHSNRIAIRVF
jgi:hypothetical protein